MIGKKIKLLVIKLLEFIIYYSGCAFLLSLISKKGVIILTYHRVNNDTEPFSVSLKNFEKQIEYLAHKKRIISLEELITNIQKGIELPKGCVVITFDDGYKNNYTNAYPILKKYNMPFTIFLATDYISSDKLIWSDELRYKIKKSNCKSIVLRTNNSQRYNMRNEKEKINTIDNLFRFLIDCSTEKRKEILSELNDKLKVEVPKQVVENTMLSWEDVKEMTVDGNIPSFGAHTCSHCNLTSVSLEDARKEIAESKHIIEKEIGKEVKFFSYPYGRYNERIKQIVKENGFVGAVTINYGENGLESDLFALKRIGVNDSLWMFKYNLMCVDVEERLQNIYYKMFKKRQKGKLK